MPNHERLTARPSPVGTLRRTGRSALLFIGLGILMTATPAAAQYFGQNKVQYKRLDFEILKTEHFDIYFYPEERPGVDIAARMAERWHVRLEQLLQHSLRGRQPLVLYASHSDFEQNNIVPQATGEGTGGVTEPLRRRIVLPLAGPLRDTDHVIGHELVHAFQYDMTTGPDDPPGRSGLELLPLWFVEGMAEYLSIGSVDPNTAMWLRDAARSEELPGIHELDDPRYFPYRWGQAFWAYVAGRWGDGVVPRLLNQASGGDVDGAIQRVLGVTVDALSADWQAAIRARYSAVAENAVPPERTGQPLLSGDGLNVGPALSPDGKKLAFLSERELLSIDLYVADAETGRVQRRLTSTATDPHFTSLQFIYSAGAWDSTSSRLAVARIADGRAGFAIYDAERGSREQDVSIPEVDEVLNPTWSPDDGSIAFTGMVAGLSDLFVYDLRARRLRRLTNDPFAELHPAWSPDGTRIAFSTDRTTTNLDTLAIGALRLAILDLTNDRITMADPFAAGNTLNAQWSRDAQSVFVLSTQNGIPNLYRIRLGSGGAASAEQLTDITTGLSGITASSPAISVATQRDIAAVTVYDKGRYAIHRLDVSTAGTAPEVSPPAAAALPPLDRVQSQVATLLASPTAGLPVRPQYEVVDYQPRLQLEGIGQPSVAVGTSPFGGATIGGGVAFAFSDMLSDHYLATGLQLNSSVGNNFSLRNIGAQAAYVNRSRRWNWGVVGGQMPYLSGGFASGLDIIDGQLVGVEQLAIFRQTERSASLLTAYPLNRARRVEFKAGVAQLSFDQIVQRTTFDPQTGVVFDRSSETSSVAPGLTLGTASAAFVSDTSRFGATSPVAGERLRLEVTPTYGSINFAGVLADYRRYFVPAPFYTLAGRILHYGRYGRGGGDTRLFPFYIGSPTLVRGYDVNSFGADECVATADSSCPLFDRLMGNRMLVANLEFRLPLLRPFGVSSRMYGPLPVEVAAFADVGWTWGRVTGRSFAGGRNDGVSSAGVAFRASLFGFAIGEFDVVRPFQRPGAGWTFQFNLTPGF